MFIQSNGGIATPEIVKENPAVLLLSGPAAGPSLARTLGLANEFRNVLSVDMGGTSFDIGVIHDGTVDTVKQQIIDGKKFSLPASTSRRSAPAAAASRTSMPPAACRSARRAPARRPAPPATARAARSRR
ncbi:MAG: hydantoinase/oxoprolinase family protein [Steroidobacteraceae bacterium]